MFFNFNLIFIYFSSVRIPADLREAFFCQAIKEGGDDEWNFLVHHYSREDWADLNDIIILRALACTADGNKIKK